MTQTFVATAVARYRTGSPNAASPPRMSAIDAAMESAMKRAKEVLRASPEDLLRREAPEAGAAAADDDDDDDPLSPEMFAQGSNADGTAMASAIKAELRSARKNMAEIRRRIDEEIAVASSPKGRTRRFAHSCAKGGRSAAMTTLSRRRRLRPRRRPALPATPLTS